MILKFLKIFLNLNFGFKSNSDFLILNLNSKSQIIFHDFTPEK